MSTFIRLAISSTCTLPLNRNLPLAFIDDALDFDVVLVANLADDLFEQIFDRHEARGAAVLVDDDRALQPLALELLQQIRNALGFGNEVRRPDQRRDRPASSSAGPRCIRSLMKTKPWTLSSVSLNTGMREYCCSRNSV